MEQVFWQGKAERGFKRQGKTAGLQGISVIPKRMDAISDHGSRGSRTLCLYILSQCTCFLFLLPVAFLYPVYKKKDLKKERIRRLTLQFKEGIMVLASFLSAGYSLENSLSLSVKELEGLYGKNRDDHRRVFLYGSRGKDEPSGGTAFS